MAQLRVLLGFAQASDHGLATLAGSVLAGLTGNATFPAPPVTLATLRVVVKDFTDAIAAQTQGGTAATAAKDEARQVLITHLRKLANYVQQTSTTLFDLLSSGFDAVSSNRAQTQLHRPVITRLDNGMSTQLIVRMPPVPNARCYETRLWIVPGQYLPSQLFGSTRDVILAGLTPGQIYSVQVRAIGGSTGFSDWSDPVSHMSM